MPKDLIAKLRKAAVRQCLKDAHKKNVNDVIVEILKQEMKKRHR